MQETTANGLTAGQTQAATELVQAVLRKLKTEEGIHAETAVAAAARMAGSYLLRASGLPLDELSPGSPIAAEAQGAQVPELVAALEATLASFAISLDRAQVPAKIPEDNEAHHSLLQMQLMFWQPFQRIVRRHELDDHQAAIAAAVATALLIRDCAPVLDPHIAFRIATHGFVDGAVTVPIVLPDAGTDDDSGKPWWKFW